MIDEIKFLGRCAKVYTGYKIKRFRPFALYLLIENRCNLRCKFCGVWQSKKQDRLTTDEIKGVIDQVSKLGVCYISITGGEPLLRDDIEEIAEYISKKGIKVGLNTNGVLLNQNRADRIAKAFDYIRVSVHGTEEIHDELTCRKGSYKATIGGIKNLVSVEGRKARVGINFVLTNENYSNIEELLDYVTKIGADFMSFLPVNFDDKFELKDPRAFEKLKGLKRKYGIIGDTDLFLRTPSYNAGRDNCDAGRLFFAILPNGDITICLPAMLPLGNVKEDSLLDLWKSGGISRIGEEYGRNCEGCYQKCTTEVSYFFRCSPVKILCNLPDIIRTYQL
jgi:MoaA/NifB/PqqE/SkfB family radical SAM enzyme